MKKIFPVLLFLAMAACTAPHSQQIGELQVSNLWLRETPPSAPVAGGFLTIDNRGSFADRLVRVESAAAQRVEIHEMTQIGDVARMRELVDGLPLPAKRMSELKTGSSHLMFIHPTQPFAEGASIPATLVFEKAGRLDVKFEVRPLAVGSGDGVQAHH